jgi:hypothetical protein
MEYGTEDSKTEVRAFRATRLWTINVCGAALGGMLTAAIMAIIAAIVLWESPVVTNRIVGAAWLLGILISAWGMYGGNWIGSAPYAVEIVKGRGLWLRHSSRKCTSP